MSRTAPATIAMEATASDPDGAAADRAEGIVKEHRDKLDKLAELAGPAAEQTGEIITLALLHDVFRYVAERHWAEDHAGLLEKGPGSKTRIPNAPFAHRPVRPC